MFVAFKKGEDEVEKKRNSYIIVILVAAVMLAVAAGVIGVSIWMENRHGSSPQGGGKTASSTAVTDPGDREKDGAVVDYTKDGSLTLPGYMGIEVDPEPADGDVLEAMEPDMVKMTDKHKGKIQAGDIVCIDQEGSVQGEVYEGLTEEDLVLRVGDHEYGEELEKKLVGRQPGDTLTVSEVMGDEYEELSGETVDYKITVKGRFDDYYANEFSGGKYPTVEKYIAHVKEELQKENESPSVAGESAWDTVVSESKVSRYPDSLLKEEIKNTKSQYKNFAELQGITYEEALSSFGQDEESLEGIAEDMVKERMIAKTIAAKENLVLDDARYKDYLMQTMMDNEEGEDNSKSGKSLEELEKEYRNDYGSRPKDDMLILLVQSFIGDKVKLINA